MPSTLFATTLADIEETVTTLIWRQWGAMGGSTSTDHAAKAIIDPEALILASLMVPNRTARVRDVLYDWVELNEGLLSMQRLRNLARDYPADLQPRVPQFERALKIRTQERRASILGNGEGLETGQIKRHARAVLAPVDAPANLMLRLRLGLGVGAKADVLAVALAEGGPLTVRGIADTTGYTSVSVRTALDDLARAGFINVSDRRPTTYLAPRKPWQTILQLPHMPVWRPLHSLFVFATEVAIWAEAASTRSVSDYALTAHLQDLMREHSQFFDAGPLETVRQVTPEELPSRFAKHLANVLQWVDTVT